LTGSDAGKPLKDALQMKRAHSDLRAEPIKGRRGIRVRFNDAADLLNHLNLRIHLRNRLRFAPQTRTKTGTLGGFG
jgi:hypothetical protein